MKNSKSQPALNITSLSKDSKNAIKQRKALAQGYEISDIEVKNDTNQKHTTSTECVKLPGWTTGCK